MKINKINSVILSELASWVQLIVISLPNSILGNFIRRKYWGKYLKCGTIRFIGRGAEIIGCDKIDLGSDFILGDLAAVQVANSADVLIGNRVGMARGTFLRSANHKTDDVTRSWMDQGHSSKAVEYKGKNYSIVIEDDVWIGANCIILTGAYIGTGSIISAGSVVSTEIPPYSIVVGNPARVVANRRKLAEIKQAGKADDSI